MHLENPAFPYLKVLSLITPRELVLSSTVTYSHVPGDRGMGILGGIILCTIACIPPKASPEIRTWVPMVHAGGGKGGQGERPREAR